MVADTSNIRFFVFFIYLCDACQCLRDVLMVVEPEYVELGQHVLMDCHYDLQGAPLYSVKWYRGYREFYRYSLSYYPQKKIFPFPFQGPYVDLENSNATQAVVRNVTFSVGGNVSCEVTTDAPTFKTRQATGHIHVVYLPRGGPPVVHVDKDTYSAMDMLQANCTSQPSHPAATITFYINSKAIGAWGKTTTRHISAGDSLLRTISNMSTVLYPGHFNDLGQIVLTCSAEIGRFYREEKTLRIGHKNGDPVPERVRSPSGRSSFLKSPAMILLVAPFVGTIQLT